MSEIPEGLMYTKTHEWVRIEDDGTATVGVTDHAQNLLGDMVFVELPEAGQGIRAGEECAVVESVKAASDVYAPLDGEVVAVNEALEESPELVNKSPFGEGWLYRMSLADAGEVDGLMDAAAYAEAVASEEH